MLEDQFRLSCLVEVDSAVDIPVYVDAAWSGNPSLTDTPRVRVLLPSEPPYYTSIIFSLLSPADFGNYELMVQVIPEIGYSVYESAQLVYNLEFSTGRLIFQLL